MKKENPRKRQGVYPPTEGWKIRETELRENPGVI